MFHWIYNLNRWYDRLDGDRPTFRFLLFITPMCLAAIMVNWRGMGVVNIVGLAIMFTMAFLRIFPIIFPRKTG